MYLKFIIVYRPVCFGQCKEGASLRIKSFEKRLAYV